MQETSNKTPPKSKIEQMLTEARVIIPGGQALLEFQLIATFKAFNDLPDLFKYVHCAALCAVALAVILLMTPAALHRLSFQGEDDPEFFSIGSRLVIAASIPLAIGISGDVAVVFFKTTGDTAIALSARAIALFALLAFWLAPIHSGIAFARRRDEAAAAKALTQEHQTHKTRQPPLRRNMKTGTETSHSFEWPHHDIGTVAIAVRWPLHHYNGGN
jgi:hypothetical protein